MAQKHPLATIEPSGLAADSGLFSDARIAMIRNTVAKDAPEDVFRAMLDIARKRNLDPLAKQIQCVKFGGSWQFITTIDGHRAIAEQTGQYAGNDAPVFTWPDPPKRTGAGKNRPESATVTVYKLLNGQRMPFSATVYWDEYDGGRNNWTSMPCTMLAKVAESHALRKAFPAVLSGTYVSEEMDQNPGFQAGYVEVQGERVHAGTGEIAPQSRPAAPQRTERPAAKAEVVHAGGDDDESPEAQLRTRLHRYVDHDSLHAWAVSKGHTSLKEATMPELVEVANQVAKPAGRTMWLATYGVDHPADDDAAQQELINDPELQAAADRVEAANRARQ